MASGDMAALWPGQAPERAKRALCQRPVPPPWRSAGARTWRCGRARHGVVPGRDDEQVTTSRLPGHDPLACTGYLIGAEIGGLADGRALIARGICLDQNDRLWLMHTWVPGLTEPTGGEPGIALNVEYGADALPASLDYTGSCACDGGASSDGEIGFMRPPDRARHAWLDFSASDDPECDHLVARLTVDLITRQVTVTS